MIINTSKKSLCVMYLLLIAILTIFLNCKDSNPVTPHIPVEKIVLSDTQISLEVGETRKLVVTVYPENATNQELIWASEDDEIATVSDDGMITGVSYGEVIIYISTPDEKIKVSFEVTVRPIEVPVTGVRLDHSFLSLKVGDSETLTATIEPENATNQQIVWSSSDDDVVIVSQDGVVEAISGGTATITATTVDGNVTAECSVSINSSDVFFILNTIQWENAINSISQGSDITNYTLMIVNDFEVSGTRVNTFGNRNDIYVTIAGDQTISLSSDSNGHLLMIGDDTQISIVLNDIGLRGHFENDASLVHIGKNSTFVMQGSSSISGNRSGEFGGGGVDNKGIFTMKDNSSIFENINEHLSTGFLRNSGGVFNSEEGFFKMMDNSSISGNTVRRDGGGVHNLGEFIMENNSSIIDNTAQGSPGHFFVSGGGVCNRGGSFTMFDKSSISNNSVFGSGGGVHNRRNNSKRGDLVMYGNSLIANNSAGWGGGVYCSESSFTMYDNSTISGNKALESGGGVGTDLSDFTMYDNTTISKNEVHGNGGGVNNSLSSRFIMLGNSKITENRAYGTNPRIGRGGGLHNESGYIEMNENASITKNEATSYGGGIFNNGEYNTIPLNISLSGNAYISHNITWIDGYGIYIQEGRVRISDNFSIFGHSGQGIVLVNATLYLEGGIIYGNGDSGVPGYLANRTALFTLEDFRAIYGDGSDILPHTDGFIDRTNHTIYGRK
ncbi:MAG: Ig-like domain-containing protein [Candidatus Cloacimonetes bacterium]|nr:Ig-like domain-containing protein [Candidatus Cloacimonadota bacterium]